MKSDPNGALALEAMLEVQSALLCPLIASSPLAMECLRALFNDAAAQVAQSPLDSKANARLAHLQQLLEGAGRLAPPAA